MKKIASELKGTETIKAQGFVFTLKGLRKSTQKQMCFTALRHESISKSRGRYSSGKVINREPVITDLYLRATTLIEVL